ncbi:MAG: MoxR family ATPase [Planctomycetaceae bacterium]|nr:MoxR family ATPase [Planctomycetaceae bacterium]
MTKTEPPAVPSTGEIQGWIGGLRDQLNQVLLGKPQVVELLLASLLARGHVLFDDLPGLGKTTLAKGLAKAVGGKFMRVQCTPDLLPSDVTGFSVLNQKSREFEFRPGPVFADVLLADEINRATPRTQSALFEAMAERQVTIEGQAHALSESFLVLATQNPVESVGAYPLPEAQLDRFTMKLRIGYPDRSSELELLSRNSKSTCELQSQQILHGDQLVLLQQAVSGIAVELPVREYLLDLAQSTRSNRSFPLGLSPRGLLQWQRVAQAYAMLRERSFVIPEDIQAVAVPVLAVRLSSNAMSTEKAIESVIASVPVPRL